MYGGYQKIGLFGCFEQNNLKKPQKDESYQEGFRTDPYSQTVDQSFAAGFSFSSAFFQEMKSSVVNTPSLLKKEGVHSFFVFCFFFFFFFCQDDKFFFLQYLVVSV